MYKRQVHNNSLLLLILGLPFDRALPWHKLLALAAIVNSVVHLLAFYVGGRGSSVINPDDAYHMHSNLTKVIGLEISGASCCMCFSSAKGLDQNDMPDLTLAAALCQKAAARGRQGRGPVEGFCRPPAAHAAWPLRCASACCENARGLQWRVASRG